MSYPTPSSPHLTLTLEIFDTVQSSTTQYGVVPFENSTHGPVLFTLDALADRQSAYTTLSVVGEIYLDVHHCLLGRPSQTTTSPSAPSSPDSQPKGIPLTPLTHLTRVYSHPQAFGQTQSFFARHLPGVECIETSSTSKAAELAASDPTGTSAAVASALSAQTNGLDILAASIEDRDDNTTRFFVIRNVSDNDENITQLPASLRYTLEEKGRRQALKGMVSFTVHHEEPGALSQVLDIFKRWELNLTSINSAPSRVRPFQYLFFVEFDGSRAEPAAFAPVEEELVRATERYRGWGHWVKQRD